MVSVIISCNNYTHCPCGLCNHIMQQLYTLSMWSLKSCHIANRSFLASWSFMTFVIISHGKYTVLFLPWGCVPLWSCHIANLLKSGCSGLNGGGYCIHVWWIYAEKQLHTHTLMWHRVSLQVLEKEWMLLALVISGLLTRLNIIQVNTSHRKTSLQRTEDKITNTY